MEDLKDYCCGVVVQSVFGLRILTFLRTMGLCERKRERDPIEDSIKEFL